MAKTWRVWWMYEMYRQNHTPSQFMMYGTAFEYGTHTRVHGDERAVQHWIERHSTLHGATRVKWSGWCMSSEHNNKGMSTTYWYEEVYSG